MGSRQPVQNLTALTPVRRSRLAGSTIELARQALAAKFGNAIVRVSGPISVRGNSEIFFADVQTVPPIEAAVKFCLVNGTVVPDMDAAKEQYAALDRVSQALARGTGGLSVPTPICEFPPVGAYAMGWASGLPLTDKLRGIASFRQGSVWFERVGAWVGAFHAAGPLRLQQVDLSDRLRVLDYIIANPLADADFQRRARLLGRAAPFMKHLKVNASWLHGDCKTDNFILTDTTVYGIDIALATENPVEYDIAQFLNNLGLWMANPLNWYLRPLHGKFEAAFWRGYKSTGPDVSMPYLHWLRLNFLLSFWRTELHAGPPGLRGSLLNMMFSSLSRQLAGNVEAYGDGN